MIDRERLYQEASALVAAIQDRFGEDWSADDDRADLIVLGDGRVAIDTEEAIYTLGADGELVASRERGGSTYWMTVTEDGELDRGIAPPAAPEMN